MGLKSSTWLARNVLGPDFRGALPYSGALYEWRVTRPERIPTGFTPHCPVAPFSECWLIRRRRRSPRGFRGGRVFAWLTGHLVDSLKLKRQPGPARVGPSGKPRPLYPLRRDGPVVVSALGCQRFFLAADAFAFFVGDATFAAGTITLCIGITIGCPGSIPSR